MKPERMTAPLERAFTGKFMGSSTTDTKWEHYASISFQDDLTTGLNGEAFEGNCQNKADPPGGLLFGLTCQDVGPDVFGFCNYDGSPGNWYTEFAMNNPSDEECLTRYIHIHLPYTVGYDGLVGGARSLTLAEIEIWDVDGNQLIPVAGTGGNSPGHMFDGDTSTYNLMWTSASDVAFQLDLGGLYHVRSVELTPRDGWPTSLTTTTITLSSEPEGAGTQCAAWTPTKALSLYPMGDVRASSENDMFDICCECGGGDEVAVGWLRDYGYEYGKHDQSDISFGWRCEMQSNWGVSSTARDFQNGWTRGMYWET